MSIIQTAGGGGGIQLAPMLDAPENLLEPGQHYKTITFDPSGALTEGLGLPDAWSMVFLAMAGLPTTEEITVKLTIDAVDIWNHTWTPGSANFKFGWYDAAARSAFQFTFKTDLSLKIQTVADTSVQIFYFGHPIK